MMNRSFSGVRIVVDLLLAGGVLSPLSKCACAQAEKVLRYEHARISACTANIRDA